MSYRKNGYWFPEVDCEHFPSEPFSDKFEAEKQEKQAEICEACHVNRFHQKIAVVDEVFEPF